MESRRGFVWAHVAGAARLRTVPATTRADAAPSLFRGRLAYIRNVGELRSVVRLASLTGGGARTVWDESSKSSFVPWQVAVGARDAVVLVTYLEGSEAASYRSHVLRAGQAPKPLTPTFKFGLEHTGGMSIERVSADGRRVTTVREVDDDAVTSVFALPSGRRVE